MQLGSTVCCSFLSSFPYLGRTTVRISWTLVPGTLEWWRCSGMEGSTCPSLCELPLCWEQSAPQRAQLGPELLPLPCWHCRNSDFVSRCALPLDSADLTQGWLCGTETCPSPWGEISVHACGSVLGKATEGLGDPGLHQGLLMLSLEYCRIDNWCTLSTLIQTWQQKEMWKNWW